MSSAALDVIDRLSSVLAKGTASASEVAAAVNGNLEAGESTVSVNTAVAAHIELTSVPSGAAVWSASVAFGDGSLSVAELEEAYGRPTALPRTRPGAPARVRLVHPDQPITFIVETTGTGAVSEVTVQSDLAEV